MSDVFISYSSKEYDKANHVRDVLKRNGISTWMAPDSIPGGSNYTKEIPKAIRECKVFLLILSQKAQGSVWVPAELEQAFKNEKLIIPFAVENCPLGDEFDFLLSRSQRIEAYEKNTDAMEKLVNTIKCSISIGEENKKMQVAEKIIANRMENRDLQYSPLYPGKRVHIRKPAQEDKENILNTIGKYFDNKNKDGYAFICHSARDIAINKNIISQLDIELNKRGIKTWMAEKNMVPGKSYTGAIPSAIEDCTVFLLFVSANSVKSSEVVSEIGFCKRFLKPIIPIVIDDVDFEQYPNWKYMLNPYQIKRVTNSNEIKDAADIIENYFE